MSDEAADLSEASGAKAETLDVQSTKERILDAAEAIFAEKGIAGARVEQIAQRAGVAKALIYYYFKSKSELFQRIIDRYLGENVSYKRAALENMTGDADFLGSLFGEGLKFSRQRNDVMRIFLLELLKKEDTEISMLSVLDRMFMTAKEFKKYLPGWGDDMITELRTELFFFASVPITLFFLLEDKWVDHYKVDRGVLEAEFINAFKKIHGEYFEKLLGNNPKEKSS